MSAYFWWCGVSSLTDLATVLQNIGRFANPDIGFMNQLPLVL
jgi:hypothetical protein